MLRIDLLGLPETQAALRDQPDAARRAFIEFAELVHEYAREGADAHTDTGALVGSLGHGPRRAPDGWIVGHDTRRAPHAVFVHWGTRPHVIEPRKRKVLRWPSGGGFVFAQRVQHPGYKGDPYLVTASDKAISKFSRILANEIRR